MRKFFSAFLLLAGAAAAQDFRNPVLRNGPDPWVIYRDGFYYETNTTGRSVAIRKCQDITELDRAERRVVWRPPVSGPYSHDIWAPELHFIQGKWYVYFAADAGTVKTHRIWVLENSAADPLSDSWVFKGQLTDPGNNRALDPSVFEEAGKLYALWSGWKADDDGMDNLYIAALANPWTVSGERVRLSSPQFSWEQAGIAVNEGPEVLQHDGKIFLIYSASACWSDDYALGMLTAQADSDLLDPQSWTKSREPVFSSSPEAHAYGPGHASFFESPDGTEEWMIYHANPEAGQGCGSHRSARIQRFTWKPDGSPDFGRPVSLGELISKPSGQVGK